MPVVTSYRPTAERITPAMATADEMTHLAANLAKLAQSLADRETEEPAPIPDTTPPERVMLTAEEAADRLGIGRTLMYRLIRTGEITSVRIGRLRRIPASSVHEYAAQLVTASQKAA